MIRNAGGIPERTMAFPTLHAGRSGQHTSSCLMRFASVPGSGSFLRPNKVDAGVDMLTALREKYASVGAENTEDKVIRLGGAPGAVEVETVGWEKVSRKQRLS